jgi:hypothetical protein
MFAALGLEWDERLLKEIFSTQHDQGSGDRKVLFTKKINTDSIGRGSTISRSFIPDNLLENMNGLLARLDYPLVGDDWDNAPSPYLPGGIAAGKKRNRFECRSDVSRLRSTVIKQRKRVARGS